MKLTQQISDDLKTAMKSGDKLRLETLRMIRAQIIEFEKRGTGKPMTEEDEMNILLTAVKKRKEAIEQYSNAGRRDLAEKETKELEIVSGYLPAQLTKEEAESVVADIINKAGASSAKDLGKVMPVAMKELKGKIDTKVISEIVRQKLG
jgi:uncharacterized protein